MILDKKNVIIYTIQLDTEEVKPLEGSVFHLCELFKREFTKEGLKKAADAMAKGGFSFKETESNSYYTEYEVSIRTRTTIL